jgi:hypothetical protein
LDTPKAWLGTKPIPMTYLYECRFFDQKQSYHGNLFDVTPLF